MAREIAPKLPTNAVGLTLGNVVSLENGLFVVALGSAFVRLILNVLDRLGIDLFQLWE